MPSIGPFGSVFGTPAALSTSVDISAANQIVQTENLLNEFNKNLVINKPKSAGHDAKVL